jgi:hypothetical protein
MEYGLVREGDSPPVVDRPFQSFLSPALPHLQVLVGDEWNCAMNMRCKTFSSKCMLNSIHRNLREVLALEV